MKSVIFLDHDREEFDFLVRGLSKGKRQFEIEFAPTGNAALALLATGRFEAIIASTHANDTDGGALLQIVCEMYPAVVRILLASQQEMEHALRAVPVAHQFLLKPCDPTMVRIAVERATNLSKILSNKMLANLVGTVERPARHAAHLFHATRQAAGSPRANCRNRFRHRKRRRYLRKIFQLVNSAFFGLPLEVSSIKTAVSFLGIQMLQNLVLAAEVFSMINNTDALPGFSFDELQSHSQLTAKIALRLPAPPHTLDVAVMAALVHDVGKLVLATRSPRHFVRALGEATHERIPLHEAEYKLMGVTHAEVGAYLLGIWGLPSPVVEAVANHHSPQSTALNDTLDAVGIVHIANILAHEATQRSGQVPGIPTQAIDPDFLEKLGLTAQYREWQDMAHAMANPMAAAS